MADGRQRLAPGSLSYGLSKRFARTRAVTWAVYPAVPARYLAPTQVVEARKKDIKNSHIPITSSVNAHGQRKGSHVIHSHIMYA